MRRSEREIRSRAEIDAVIRGCQVCRLAFAVAGEPYIVPLSFGYDGECLYFHTAREGKKIACLEVSSRVCFELEREVRLIQSAESACGWSFAFESVIGFGTVHELLSAEDKAAGLNRIMEHYSGCSWGFEPAALDRTRVWRASIMSITGKRAEPARS